MMGAHATLASTGIDAFLCFGTPRVSEMHGRAWSQEHVVKMRDHSTHQLPLFHPLLAGVQTHCLDDGQVHMVIDTAQHARQQRAR